MCLDPGSGQSQAFDAVSSGGTSTGGAPCALPPDTARTHPGNFDNRSCNSAGCHVQFVGGWVYTNAAADGLVGQATVTLTSSDGSQVTAQTASDGFFQLEGAVTSPFTPCVVKCEDEACATEPHTSTDCQGSSCHGADNQRIHLTQGPVEPQGTGGVAAGEDCTPPASGGPHVHVAAEYNTVACQICHDQLYTGGFLYDGITGTTTVAQATITLTPENGGAALTAVTGLDGMFYFEGIVPSPYTVCVSKCPNTVCGSAVSHSGPDDCRTCHDDTQRIYLP